MIWASVAAQNMSEIAQVVILCGTFVAAVLIGCLYQFRSIRREGRGSGLPPRSRARTRRSR